MLRQLAFLKASFVSEFSWDGSGEVNMGLLLVCDSYGTTDDEEEEEGRSSTLP